jgi:hypothetical protein
LKFHLISLSSINYINNNLIPKVVEIIYLGVKFNNKLNFNDHAIEKFGEVQKQFVIE